MPGLSCTARAPSNIALIKYMGKDDAELNLPANGSISLTLESLCTFTEVTRVKEGEFNVRWVDENPRLKKKNSRPFVKASFSEAGISRALKHVDRVRTGAARLLPQFGLDAYEHSSLEIRSANTFPAASGIASSASGFAALTLSTAMATAANPDDFIDLYEKKIDFRRALSDLSRQGSGSSCRSFEGPWVLWENQHAAAIETRMPRLTDFVLLIGAQPKEVSSSEAHSLVKTSPLWEGRFARVNSRIRMLELALAEGDLASLSRVAWAEMWEMHSLFHTCAKPFSYWEPGTMKALRWLMGFMHLDLAPIVTMDAGANVHLLVPTAAADEWRNRLHEHFLGWEILEDHQSQGAIPYEITVNHVV